MKRIPIMAVVVAILIIISFTTDNFAQSSHKKKKAKHAAAASTPACAADMASCPLEGCGSDFDGLLNQGKNRVTPPADADVIDMSLNDMRGLAQPQKTATEPAWENNRDRSTLQGPEREGQPVRVMAYLWSAKREHEESCNCGLDASGIPGQLLTDIHMVLTSRSNSKESTSVTAEITPRVRATRPNPETWDWSSIQTFNKKFIRVTGYLLLDTHHLIQNPLVRKTNWEVHPVTKLEVCVSTATKCRAGTGWVSVN